MSKKEERKHVEKQVHIIEMNKPRGYESPILFVVLDRIWVEQPFLVNIISVPRVETSYDGNNQYASSGVKIHLSRWVK